jgi:transglutaminase-like putative cysteine protease
MSIRVALHHKTHYQYKKPISIFPQVVRLRPAPHARTPIHAYSLKIQPGDHFINWMQDPFGNYQARLVFPEKADKFTVEVDLVAEMTVINPFDFFLEEYADEYPFKYTEELKSELLPYLQIKEDGNLLKSLISKLDLTKRRTVDFLVYINQIVHSEVGYIIRMEPGVQTSEETLILKKGSCRDSAWLLVQMLRHIGLAARFTSGYLIQLVPDVKAIDGPSGTTVDFTDLHAWTEVYLPGAGWVGLDPTSGLFAGEGHIPLACTPNPSSAAPIAGGIEKGAEAELQFEMSVTRIEEEQRVTKPYTEEVWNKIYALGQKVDKDLKDR